MRTKNKLIYGVGINDADYAVHYIVNGKQVRCPFYRAWKNMVERCYSEKFHERHPTYIDCSVIAEWHLFSNFKTWMQQQDSKGKQLDKDLLYSSNKQYGPDACVFISRNLNMLLTDSAAKRGVYPLGVYWSKTNSKFRANIVIAGKQKHLGCFSTTEAAHKAWQQAKKEIIYDAALEQTDERLKAALLLRCDKLQYDIDNDLETIKL